MRVSVAQPCANSLFGPLQSVTTSQSRSSMIYPKDDNIIKRNCIKDNHHCVLNCMKEEQVTEQQECHPCVHIGTGVYIMNPRWLDSTHHNGTLISS